MSYLNAKIETSVEILELPLETDGTLLLSTLTSQHPKASGLKFKGETGNWRAVKILDGKFFAPEGGFGETVFTIVVPESSKKILKLVYHTYTYLDSHSSFCQTQT